MKKTSLIISFLFGILFFCTICFNYKDNALSYEFYLISFILSLFCGVTFNELWKRSNIVLTAPSIEKDADFDCMIRYRAPMSRFVNKLITDGGVGYLLTDRLVFISYNFLGRKKIYLEIPFVEIKSILDFKFCNIINTGLEIKMISGKKERFTIDKKSEFYSKLRMHGS